MWLTDCYKICLNLVVLELVSVLSLEIFVMLMEEDSWAKFSQHPTKNPPVSMILCSRSTTKENRARDLDRARP